MCKREVWRIERVGRGGLKTRGEAVSLLSLIPRTALRAERPKPLQTGLE